MMFTLSMGIMAYNEEAVIGLLLQSILKQKIIHGRIREVIIVASGCTDGTEEIVRDFMEIDSRITLLRQHRRRGKASAVNLFLKKASGEILILESGDTVPGAGALEKLVAPFADPRVGMTGARPIPINSKKRFMGFTVHLMWALHHKIALMSPKLGELVAFRNFVREIPGNTAVDEASIESIVTKAGYRLHYVQDAVVWNKGPETVKDFIKQRRRIDAGHKHLLRDQKHTVSTSDPKRILRVLIGAHAWSFKNTLWTFGAVGLEMIGRALGWYDFHVGKKNPFVWRIVTSTKKWD